MEIKELLEEFEKIYINKCYEDTNKKCLALDEQEFAIIQMCLEILENKLGQFNKGNYKTKDLFVLLVDSPLNGEECSDRIVENLSLKVKMIKTTPGYDFETAPNVLWLYYALLILYANEDATIEHNTTIKSKRNYFKVYAYVSCICPKVFCPLLFNQIYIFMKRTSEPQDIRILREYFIDTKELWKGYSELLQLDNRNLVVGRLHSQFRRKMGGDTELVKKINEMDHLHSRGFLAFNYKGREPAEQNRLKRIIHGIEYFEKYLNFFEIELVRYVDNTDHLYEDMNEILLYAKKIKERICELLTLQEAVPDTIDNDFCDIGELIYQFEKYCDGLITLIAL
ncbi:hypothetical protein ABXS75_13280 [Roseburia hominis]